MNLLEMEDHHHHQEYSMMGDLRQLMSAPTSTTFPSSLSPQPIADLFPGHPNLTPTTHYHNNLNINMNMMAFPFAPLHHQLSTPPALHDFPSTINNVTTAHAASTPPLSTEADTTCGPSSLCFPPDPSNGRWPRQETLTLLQIRSRLHHKFKDANQKGPLWDELSRIMSEEFGYQRSGKKCREKFENLYKYYKKTKEGKAGRQDGKHYRFFRQLEALCGENNSNPSTSTIPEAKFGSSSLNHSDPSQTNHEKTTMFNYKQHHCESTVSLSNNSTELETSSSSEEDHHNNNVNDESVAAKERKRRWKRKIRDFIDSQMKEVMEKQEAWLERVMKTLEEKEKERVLREEEWSRNEAERAEREHKFWAKERAWIEARDSALMEALQKLTGIRVVSSRKELEKPKEEEEEEEEEEGGGGGGSEIVHESWEECEMSTLVQIRGEIVHESGYSSEETLWEEVATKMASFGYQKTASMCRRKWQNITNPHHLKQAGNNNNVMKRSENSSTRCFYFHTSPYNQGQGNTSAAYSNISQQHQPHASSPSNSNVGDASHSDNSCFPFFMCEGENLWENYGLNLNKGNRNP